MPIKNSVLSGAALKVVIRDEANNKIVGRGSNFNWSDTFEQFPVDEYGKTGVDEYVAGRMLGSGAIGSFLIPVVNDQFQTRASFANKKYTVEEVVTAERSGEGEERVVNRFTGVKFSQVSGTFAATGLAGRSANFVYSDRKTNEELQPESVKPIV